MIRTKLFISCIVLACVVFGVAVDDASAIPAFARKYKLSCTTCHAPAPRLKEFGEEFAGNGFQLPDAEEPARAFRDTGDEFLTLQTSIPFAVRFDAFAGYEDYDGTDGRADLKAPWGVKLMSGGNIAPDVGYYMYFYMSEHGEVAGLEDAYVHFNDLGDAPLDVMIGQFQITDPMMKRELRLTYEDYDIYTVRPGNSGARLTYDRGVMVTYDTPVGIGLVGEIVNGNGKPEARDGNYDHDQDKGYAVHASWGQGPFGIGGFAYVTSEEIVIPGANPGDPSLEYSNDVTVFGPDLSIAFGETAVFTGQYLYREDSDPGLMLENVETTGLVAELVLQPWGPDAKDAFVLMYNQVDSDDDLIDLEAWTASWSHLHRRNLRMVAEFTYDVEREGFRSYAGFSAAF